MQESSGGLLGLMGKLKTAFTSTESGEKFTCGDCERWERCGLRPNENCVARAAQIELGAERPRRRRLMINW